MMKISIVEDDSLTAQTVEKYLHRFFSKTDTAIEVIRYADAISFLKRYDKSTDIVFMDINMPGLNGMDAAKKLRERDGEVIIIFVTNLVQCAVDGYEVGAFDFIVKPISYGSFSLKLRRVSQMLQSKIKRQICVSTRQGKTLINAEEITYIEIMRHVVTYHTVRGDYVGSGSLTAISEELDGLPFAMCNRCYLVNLKYVRQIDGNDVIVGGNGRLQIAAPRRKEFLQKFNDYLASGGEIK